MWGHHGLMMRNCASFSKSTSKNPIKYEQPTQKFVKWGFSSLLCSRIEIESVHSPQYIYAIAHQFPKDVALFGDCTHYRLTYQKSHFFAVLWKTKLKGSWNNQIGWRTQISLYFYEFNPMYVFTRNSSFACFATSTLIRVFRKPWNPDGERKGKEKNVHENKRNIQPRR